MVIGSRVFTGFILITAVVSPLMEDATNADCVHMHMNLRIGTDSELLPNILHIEKDFTFLLREPRVLLLKICQPLTENFFTNSNISAHLILKRE